MIRVAIIGVTGRMGRALVSAANGPAAASAAASAGTSVAGKERESGIVVAAGVASAASVHIGKDIGELAGLGAFGIAVTSDLRSALAQCDVAIDFSSPAATAANVAACEAARKPLVVGTTGFSSAVSSDASSDADRAIEKAAQSIAVLVAPNTSLGVTLLIELVKAAAKTLPADFDIEITEAHHRNKRDAPSGTALALGKAAAQGRGQDLDSVAVKARTGETPRGQGEIGFAVTRGGDIVGDHTVVFAGTGEHLVLGHRATDRSIFARGALKAAAWLLGRPAGRYAMRDVVGYKTEA